MRDCNFTNTCSILIFLDVLKSPDPNSLISGHFGRKISHCNIKNFRRSCMNFAKNRLHHPTYGRVGPRTRSSLGARFVELAEKRQPPPHRNWHTGFVQFDFSLGFRGYCNNSDKKRSREVFASLGSSHGFLSMIFGILGKFWIDIGKNILQKNIFSR